MNSVRAKALGGPDSLYWSLYFDPRRQRGGIPRATMNGCDVSQTTCPWNVKYATLLPAGSPFAPREALAGKDARTLAREILGMDVDAYRAAFKGSPMKRAKLRGLKRNAAVLASALERSAEAQTEAGRSRTLPLTS
ncbi:hypothetical protein [Roseisolibacter agri]|uniref:hypothetical protein n=1 Tax=Roseisolibacter agri TaxID=2014610 RepID=UPI0024E158EC|nr:hypothetical protein [Roseisolibacter agri]